MNRKQKVAIVIGALVIAGLALFPPWVRHLTEDDMHVYLPEGLHWAFRRSDLTWGLRVDRGCLHDLQLAALVLTVAAVLVLRDKKA